MQIWVHKTHTMSLGISKNIMCQNVGTGFSPKKKLNLFTMIEKIPVDIEFNKTVDNIKDVNRNNVTP